MMSPGWQSSSRQIASSVENRMAFAFPFFEYREVGGRNIHPFGQFAE